MKTINILGYEVCAISRDTAAKLAWQSIVEGGTCRYMACANPHSLIQAHTDCLFSNALRSADILLPDGAGILVAARLLGAKFPERIAGMDFFMGLLRVADSEQGARVYFLGSTESVLGAIGRRIESEFSRIDVCGSYSPPFESEFSESQTNHMINAVNSAQPDILWVGMTAPKQEKWIFENRNRLDAKFIGAIGAVFDFYAESKSRAPAWVQEIGLEWLPRLIREPRRLWKRTLVSAPVFLSKVVRQRLIDH